MSIEQMKSGIYLDANIYLIKGSEKAALVDSGTGVKPEVLISNITESLAGQPLDYVFATHRHQDHCGLIWKLVQELGCEAYMGEIDAIPISKGDTEASLGAPFGAKLEPAKISFAKEGMKFELGGHRLAVLETPGHTPGHIGLYDEITGALFPGDTISVNGIGRLDTPLASKDDMYASMKRLSQMNVNGLYPGHGQTLATGGLEQIERGMKILETL